MPVEFHDLTLGSAESSVIWAPLERAPQLFSNVDWNNRGNRLIWGIGRLADGQTVGSAAEELRAIGVRVSRDHVQTNRDFVFRAQPLAQTFFVDARKPLWLLLAGSAFVLLIGCANVASLLLVRSAAECGRSRCGWRLAHHARVSSASSSSKVSCWRSPAASPASLSLPG